MNPAGQQELLTVRSGLAPNAQALLKLVQHGLEHDGFRSLAFEEMPDASLDDRRLRHRTLELVVSRVWDLVSFKRCDDPDFQYVIERCLLLSKVRVVDIDIHFGINFSSEQLCGALRNGLQCTASLHTLVLGAIRMTEAAAQMVGEGLRACRSLRSLEIVSTIFDDEAGAAHVGRGIRHNASIKRILVEGIDEGLPTLVEAFGGRPHALDELVLSSGSHESLNDAVGALHPLVANGKITNGLTIVGRSSYDEEHHHEEDDAGGRTALDLSPIVNALREGGCQVRELEIECSFCTSDSLVNLFGMLSQSVPLQAVRLWTKCAGDAPAFQQTILSNLPQFRLRQLHLTSPWEWQCESEMVPLVDVMSRNFEIQDFECVSNSSHTSSMTKSGYFQIRRYCQLNAAGRRLFPLVHQVTPSIWAPVLERINRLQFLREKHSNGCIDPHDDDVNANDRNNDESTRADVLFAFLRGPLLSVVCV